MKHIVAFGTTNYRLSIDIGMWLNIPMSRDDRVYHFCSYNAFENKANLVLECFLSNPIRDIEGRALGCS